jgi:hypothetical protein
MNKMSPACICSYTVRRHRWKLGRPRIHLPREEAKDGRFSIFMHLPGDRSVSSDWVMDWTTGVRFSAGQDCLRHNVQTYSRVSLSTRDNFTFSYQQMKTNYWAGDNGWQLRK